MALSFAWMERRTQSAVEVGVRVDADHTVTVGSISTTVDHTVADGTELITVPVDASAQVLDVSVDGVVVDTVSVPAWSATTAIIGFGACHNIDYDFLPGYWLHQDKRGGGCQAFLHLGDWMYESEVVTNKFGNTTLDIVNGTTPACREVSSWYTHQRASYNIPGWRTLCRNMPLLKIADDHEFIDLWSNADEHYTTTAINHLVADEGLSRSEALAAIKARAIAAEEAYCHAGNGVGYHWQDIGAARLFFINCTRYKSSPYDADGVGKTMLGATQKQWLKDGWLAAMEAGKQIVIVSGKGTLLGYNEDGFCPFSDDPVTFPGYFTELAELLAYQHSNDIAIAAWLVGDTHHAYMGHFTPAEVAARLGIGSASDYSHHFTVNATPVGRIDEQDLTLAEGYLWTRQKDGVGRDKLSSSVYGRLIVTPDYVQTEIWSRQRKRLGWGRVYAGSNQMTEGRWA